MHVVGYDANYKYKLLIVLLENSLHDAMVIVFLLPSFIQSSEDALPSTIECREPLLDNLTFDLARKLRIGSSNYDTSTRLQLSFQRFPGECIKFYFSISHSYNC